jgi:hypothetical protein
MPNWSERDAELASHRNDCARTLSIGSRSGGSELNPEIADCTVWISTSLSVTKLKANRTAHLALPIWLGTRDSSQARCNLELEDPKAPQLERSGPRS